MDPLATGRLQSMEGVDRPLSGSLSPSWKSYRSSRSVSNFSLVSTVSSESESIPEYNFRWQTDLEDSLRKEKLIGVLYDILKAADKEIQQGYWDDVVNNIVDYCTKRENKEGLRYLSFALFQGDRRLTYDPFCDALALLLFDNEVKADITGRLLIRCLQHWKQEEADDSSTDDSSSETESFQSLAVKLGAKGGAYAHTPKMEISEALALDPEKNKEVLCCHIGGRLALSALSPNCLFYPYRDGIEVKVGALPRHSDCCSDQASNVVENYDIPVLLTGHISVSSLVEHKNRAAKLPIEAICELRNQEIRRIDCSRPPQLPVLEDSEVQEVAGGDEPLCSSLLRAVARERQKQTEYYEKRHPHKIFGGNNDGSFLKKIFKG